MSWYNFVTLYPFQFDALSIRDLACNFSLALLEFNVAIESVISLEQDCSNISLASIKRMETVEKQVVENHSHKSGKQKIFFACKIGIEIQIQLKPHFHYFLETVFPMTTVNIFK